MRLMRLTSWQPAPSTGFTISGKGSRFHCDLANRSQCHPRVLAMPCRRSLAAVRCLSDAQRTKSEGGLISRAGAASAQRTMRSRHPPNSGATRTVRFARAASERKTLRNSVAEWMTGPEIPRERIASRQRESNSVETWQPLRREKSRVKAVSMAAPSRRQPPLGADDEGSVQQPPPVKNSKTKILMSLTPSSNRCSGTWDRAVYFGP